MVWILGTWYLEKKKKVQFREVWEVSIIGVRYMPASLNFSSKHVAKIGLTFNLTSSSQIKSFVVCVRLVIDISLCNSFSRYACSHISRKWTCESWKKDYSSRDAEKECTIVISVFIRSGTTSNVWFCRMIGGILLSFCNGQLHIPPSLVTPYFILELIHDATVIPKRWSWYSS